MSGDSIEAQESQGLVNNPQGDVEQHFGDRNDINTGGGDVAQRDIDKSTTIVNNVFLGGLSSPQSPNNLVEELRKILDRIGIGDSDQKSAYQAALASRLDGNAHPVKTDDRLSELDDRRVLPEFVNFLTRNSTLSEPTRNELKKFISEHGISTNRVDFMESTIKKILKSYLVIVIQELKPQPNPSFQVNAFLMPDDSVKGGFNPLIINEVLHEGIKNSLWEPDKISALVKNLLEQSLDLLSDKDYELTIEFFLPIDYLSTEVEKLKIIPDPSDREVFDSVSTKYRVLVRSTERLHNGTYKHFYGQWKTNWDLVDKNLKGVPCLESFEPFATVNSSNWEKRLALKLKTKLGIKITCIPPELERKRIVKAILKSASPIAIWLRKNVTECDHESELDRLLTSDILEKLPECIREKREEADLDDTEEHFGNHLVLLWEDPHRVPFYIDTPINNL